METVNNTVTEPAAVSAEETPAASRAGDAAAAPAEEISAKDQVQDAAKQETAAKTYDQAYIDKLLKDQEEARAAAVAEALKVAGMDESAKASYEKEKQEKALMEREARIAQRELKADAAEVMAKNNVPHEFLNMLVGKDREETKANVVTFKGIFDAAVQEQVESRLAGTTPKGGNGSGAQSETEAMSAEIDKYL